MKLTRTRAATAALLVLVLTLLAIFVAGDSGGIHVRKIFGQRLTESGQRAYVAEQAHGHRDTGSVETETPPAEVRASLEHTAELLKRNQRAAEQQTKGPSYPLTLAAREPVDLKRILPRNYSSRHGARPALLVVHDAEMPNVPGLQDLYAIAAWFSNPQAQASSNYSTDAEGNSIELVPETEKAWTQAFFNGWAVSDELLGYASQKTWPDAQLRAAAKIFAASSARWGIPVRKGVVHGCTIVRSGIVQHSDLGACGGGHHDAGPNFPMAHFIELVREYRSGGYHPKPKPLAACTTANAQRALNRQGAHLGVDGIAGPLTRAAMSRYQRTHRLPVTGKPDRRSGQLLRLAGCAGVWIETRPLAAGDFTLPALFSERRGLFYDNIATTGGIRVDRLRSVPGGAIDLVILNPRDPRATLALRDQLATQAVMTGINTDPHWYAAQFPSSWRDDNGLPLADPLRYRQQVSADTLRLLRIGDPVVLDLEKIPRGWAEAFLEGTPTSSVAGWRGRNGQLWNGGTNEFRPTAWTNEPHQANPADLIIAAHIAYLAQLYDCCMNDRPAWPELQWDAATGIPPAGAFPIYDAADYQLDELTPGSYLFNQDRLVWLFQ